MRSAKKLMVEVDVGELEDLKRSHRAMIAALRESLEWRAPVYSFNTDKVAQRWQSIVNTAERLP